MNTKISLCICTYNRCNQLSDTLQSLLTHRDSLIDGDEVLLIDNNSNDQTRSVIAEYQNILPLTYHFEPVQGLSAARNKGLAVFNNDVIVFIDDDITITNNFFDEYRKAFKACPDHGFFGGKIHVDWGASKPSWYQSDELPLINGLIGYYDQGDKDLQFNTSSLLPYGANFALRRDLIDQVGSFNLALGVNATQLGRGEETDYFKRALQLGFNGLYLANVKVLHRFQVERFTLTYLYKYGIQKGIAVVNFDNVKQQDAVSKIINQLFAGIYQLLKFRRDRFYQCVINIGLIRGIQIATKHETN